MALITFKECPLYGYAARTAVNAESAEVTIAIAIDFNTSGEKHTMQCVINAKKKYIPVKWADLYDIRSCLTHFHYLRSIRHPFVLNIAGNGIYTLQLDQEKIVDKMIHHFLSVALNGTRVRKIRSGGQTGVDEAGLKAAVKLGIPAFCLAPKQWWFRDITGRDIANEELFKQRFE